MASLAFFKQMVSNYRTTGAVLPSSRKLARAMTAPARSHKGIKRVLEVGPGTGAFSRELLTTLNPGDQYHLVEISELFCQRLRASLLDEFCAANANIVVQLHCSAIEEAELTGTFDYIVCGLPFNNFPVPLVRSIFRQMFNLLADDGRMTYFEYVGMKACKRMAPGRASQRKLMHRIAAERRIEHQYQMRRELILANVPPAYAIHYRR